METTNDRQRGIWIRDLDDERQEVRVCAINYLGDSRDELCLKELRERLRTMTQEHQALIIAVGKLKQSLGIK
jgi:HEAT repeat protein